ncbi:M23 family metallopeptidase [Proteinivorax tanatarense]|uniref:M23 family metallopeptidase n=1 Tax=Proteinivorax tanatarense TaxID=1260629 RepID=A0AAU7VL55_9FIRM
MGKLSAMLLVSILVFSLGITEATGLGSMDFLNPDRETWEEKKENINKRLEKHLEEKEEKEEIIEYQVKSGDSISSIARENGIKPATILHNNKIENKHLIKPGQKLIFPTVDGFIYTVDDCVELEEIAESYNIDKDSIVKVNILESEKLEVGTKLILPDVTPSYTQLASRGGERATLTWPVTGAITSSYGYRMHPIRNVKSFHRGIDIGAKRGTPILAAASGEVVYSGYRSSYGNTVILKHGESFTLYAHAHKLKVEEGQWVEKGEVIATVGATGMATGPHLHFEVRIDENSADRTVDPKNFLP